MNIHEYQAKKILASYGIEIPKGAIAYTPLEAKKAAEKISLKGPWVLKAQVQAGARAKGYFKEKSAGRQGGIRYITGKKDIALEAAKMLGATLVTPQTGAQGKLVSKIYVEKYQKAVKSFYLSFIINRTVPCVSLLVAENTDNILEVAVNRQKQILRIDLTSKHLFEDKEIKKITTFLCLEERHIQELKNVLSNLYHAFISLDATMLEINPIGLTSKGVFVALDAKISFDDNALYRHPEIARLQDDYEENANVLKAKKQGFKYREFEEGNIGLIVNGDGLALSANDFLKLGLNRPACLLNIKGGADKEKIASGLKILMTSPKVEGILVNVLGGFLRCDMVAEGIISAASEIGFNVPIAVRFEGTNKQKAQEILEKCEFPIIIASNIEEAVKKLSVAIEEAE